MIRKALALVFLFSASAYAGGQFSGLSLAVLRSTGSAAPNATNPAMALRQSTITWGGTAASLTATSTNTIAVGNVVVCVAGNDGILAVPDTGLADNLGNTYQIQVKFTATGENIAFFLSTVTTGGTATWTYTNAAAAFNILTCAEISGTTTAPLVEATNSNSSAGSTTPNGGSVSTNGKSMILGYAQIKTGSPTITPGSGYTIISKQEDGNYEVGAFEYSIQTGAGSYNPDYTLNGSQPWAAISMNVRGK